MKNSDGEHRRSWPATAKEIGAFLGSILLFSMCPRLSMVLAPFLFVHFFSLAQPHPPFGNFLFVIAFILPYYRRPALQLLLIMLYRANSHKKKVKKKLMFSHPSSLAALEKSLWKRSILSHFFAAQRSVQFWKLTIAFVHQEKRMK